MDDPLINLLHECVVKLSIPGKRGHGTGFFVAPGLILTCAHVVGNLKNREFCHDKINVRWKNQKDFAKAWVDGENWFPDIDIALLKYVAEQSDDPPCVLLGSELRTDDPLYTFGYPDIDFPNGRPVSFICEGYTGDEPPLVIFKLGNIRPGMSGSPVLNRRTGFACGMVKLTLDRGSIIGGGGVTTATILKQISDFKLLQERFHGIDKRWLDCMDPKIDLDPSHAVPAPPPPAYCLERKELVNHVKGLILNSLSDSIGVTSSTKVGIHGMGGIGKTVLASLVVNDPQIRNSFQHGIYWLTIGQTPNIVNRQVQLAKAISGINEQFIDIQDGPARVKRVVT